jgi:hypothetical protein
MRSSLIEKRSGGKVEVKTQSHGLAVGESRVEAFEKRRNIPSRGRTPKLRRRSKNYL